MSVHFSKGQHDSCVGDNQETWGQLGFNAVTVGKYINLLITATSFSAKCSIIRHKGYHHFFAEHFLWFLLLLFETMQGITCRFANANHSYSTLFTAQQVNIITFIISIRQRKEVLQTLLFYTNLKTSLTAGSAYRAHFDFSGTSIPDVGTCGFADGAPDYLPSGKLLIFTKCQVRVTEHSWKARKSKPWRCQLNYPQKNCSRNRCSTWALFFFSAIFFCWYIAIFHLFTNIYEGVLCGNWTFKVCLEHLFLLMQRP